MKQFLLKYKWVFIFWIVFLAVLLIFAPKQSEYYLNDDIKGFKKSSLTPFLLWTWATISLLFIFILFIKIKSIKNAFLSFLYLFILTAFFLFIFQDLFLAGALFINRQFKKGSFQKGYVVNYLAGTAHTKDNFIAYDISTKQTCIDPKLTNKLFKTGLKQNDTVTLKLDTGLFGIAFPSQSFNDN